MIDPLVHDPSLRPKLAALCASYERLTGESLGTPETVFLAPFVLLAHGTQDPPILWYGNARALELWRMSFADFTRMPSRQTAEPDLREVRERLLAQVREKGIITDYTGVRIASDGTRFLIERATVWNITAQDGSALGQAAMFRSTSPL